MEVTAENLKQIEEFASCYMSVKEIEMIMGFPADAFRLLIAKGDNAVYAAFAKGRLMTKLAVNKSIIDCAKAGSNPAQKEVLNMANKLKNSDPYDELD